MKETESLEEKKWEGHGCSGEAVVHTRAKHTHMVWTKTKPEHMVSAEEDLTRKEKRGAQRGLFRSIQAVQHAAEQVD